MAASVRVKILLRMGLLLLRVVTRGWIPSVVFFTSTPWRSSSIGHSLGGRCRIYF